MKNYALITGASKGIGKAIAYELAKRGYPLLLVARSGDLLEKITTDIRAKHSVDARYIATDLVLTDSATSLRDYVDQQGLNIGILVNNAGMGFWDPYHKLPIQKIEKIDALNVETVKRMVHTFTPALAQNERAHILNVASMAAFQPIPYQSIYSAGKAYVYFFSRAIRPELRKEGINVTCLCPGGVWTDFMDAAGTTHVANNNKLFMMSAEKCARIAVNAMFRKRPRIIPGWYNQVAVLGVKLFPLSWAIKISERMFRKD